MQSSLFGYTDNLLPYHGEVLFFPGFFTKAESDSCYSLLLEQINWKHEAIKMFGKEVMQPRLTAWYGAADKPYSYSGITMHPAIWTDTLLQIKKRIESVAAISFTSALLNLYRSGNDSMGWHRDNEKELGINPVIGSVSFGATRTFQLRDYNNKSIIKSIELTHGSLLLMRGETQHCWEHRIPKESTPFKERINITFRKII